MNYIKTLLLLLLSGSTLLAVKQKPVKKHLTTKKIRFSPDMLDQKAMTRKPLSPVNKQILKAQINTLNGDRKKRQEIEEIARTLLKLKHVSQNSKHQKAKRSNQRKKPYQKTRNPRRLNLGEE